MTNNTPDYNDNLYFEEKKMDCNEIQAKDVACNKISLTEQCRRGELSLGKYYIECKDGSVTTMYLGNDDYSVRSIRSKGFKILAPVPSYKQLNEILESEEKSHLQADSYYNKILELKELLKECRDVMNMAGYVFTKVKDVEKAKDLIKKIGEVLK